MCTYGNFSVHVLAACFMVQRTGIETFPSNGAVSESSSGYSLSIESMSLSVVVFPPIASMYLCSLSPLVSDTGLLVAEFASVDFAAGVGLV